MYPNQTANVNGRLVTDNLHSILFMKGHCIDAKKAFNSVSNQCTETLVYLSIMDLNHNSLSVSRPCMAKILRNCHLSKSIDIKGGYKQGDALANSASPPFHLQTLLSIVLKPSFNTSLVNDLNQSCFKQNSLRSLS
jgi:hypothetical protein